MIEIREDPITKDKVIINETRNFRPKKYEKEKVKGKEKKECFFCRSNEKLTPPTIYRDKKEWTIRSFENKFPILNLQKFKQLKKGFYNSWKGHGFSEVFVTTQKHNEYVFDFSASKWADIIYALNDRVEELEKLEDIKYVLVFHNHGKEGGASIKHSHFQILAMPIIPPVIKKESEVIKDKKCGFCKLVNKELSENRIVFKNEDFVAFTNYASKFPYEVHIYSIEHIKNLQSLDEEQIFQLSECLNKVFNGYKKIFNNLSINSCFHISPKNKNFHMHIEIYPRINKFAGVELGAEVYVNTKSPEKAAKELREVIN